MMIKTECVFGRGANVSKNLRAEQICKSKKAVPAKKIFITHGKKSNFCNQLLHKISNKKISEKIHSHHKNKNLFDNEINIDQSNSPINDFSLNEFHHIKSENLSIHSIKNSENFHIEKTTVPNLTLIELHNLIKKISLSFNENKMNSSFYVSQGLFKNAHFSLCCNKNDLDIVLLNARPEAVDVLKQHQNYLSKKLAAKEINLQNLVFK